MSSLDNEVITQYQDGDMNAFRTVYEKTSSFVFNVIRRMGLTKEEAEDMTHDVYVKLYDKRHLYSPDAPFEAWVKRVTINHVLNIIKRKRNFSDKLSQLFHSKPAYHTDNYQDEGPLMLCLKKMKPDYSMCLVLKELEGYSYDEIANTLNISIGTVKSRLNRAKEKLRVLYKQEVGS